MKNPMDWHTLLQRRRDLTGEPPRPGAAEAELAAVEARLKIALPPSYRAFLKASNGLGPLDDLSPLLRPAGEINWFRVEHRDTIKAYTDPVESEGRTPDEAYFDYGPDGSPDFRPKHFRHALQISGVEESAAFLLNPQVIDADGEWEAWHFANWTPGITRHRSFAAMVLAHLRPLVDVADFPPPAPPPGLPDEYRGAAGAAGRKKVRRPKPRTIEQLAKDIWSTSESKRRSAAQRLGRSRDARAAEPLIDTLRRSDPQTRQWAALALGTLGDPAGFDPLLAALDDEEGMVANMAIHALAGLGDARAVGPLLARLDPSQPHREVAAFALAFFDDPRAAEVLAGQLATSADRIAAHLTATLLAQHGRRGLDHLAQAADHPSPAVCLGVINGLYHGLWSADHPAAEAALHRLSADPDPAVRDAAGSALSILTPRLGRRARGNTIRRGEAEPGRDGGKITP